jgi:hypothetical protein
VGERDGKLEKIIIYIYLHIYLGDCVCVCMRWYIYIYMWGMEEYKKKIIYILYIGI